MNRRLIALGSAGALACGVMSAAPVAHASAPAPSATVSAPAAVARPAMQAVEEKHHPFTVKAGKIYYVHSHVHGVKRGERNAVESHYFHKWHVLGSWRLHRGQHKFDKRMRASHPGTYTLRLQFERHGHLLKGTASNAFKVKVKGFHHPKVHHAPHHKKPHFTPNHLVPTDLMKPNDTLTDWTSAQCGVGNYEGLVGLGTTLFIPSPITQAQTGTFNINQVVWVRDGNPGGTYGNWYIATTDEQAISPPQPGIITITGQGDIKNSSYLDDLYVGYPAQNEYHQIAWDAQIQGSDGTWTYINANSYGPASYIQWSETGQETYSGSSTCETWADQGP